MPSPSDNQNDPVFRWLKNCLGEIIDDHGQRKSYVPRPESFSVLSTKLLEDGSVRHHVVVDVADGGDAKGPSPAFQMFAGTIDLTLDGKLALDAGGKPRLYPWTTSWRPKEN